MEEGEKMSFTVKTYTNGLGSSNCYIIRDDKSGETLAIDPGVYDSRFEKMLADMGVEALSYILLTHGHFDHITGVKALKESFGGLIAIHKADEKCLTDAEASRAIYFGFEHNSIEPDLTLYDGDTLEFAGTDVKVLHTPGHTKGSVCFLLGSLLFSGDTLFRDSMGRTDFPGGSNAEMAVSLKRLSLLDGDFTVYPGHESATTLERERRLNPFMKGL